MLIMFGLWTGSWVDMQCYFLYYRSIATSNSMSHNTVLLMSSQKCSIVWLQCITLLNEENLRPNPYQMDRHECRPHNKPRSHDITYTLCYVATPFGSDYSRC